MKFYTFGLGDPHGDEVSKELLGGKGLGLVEMASLGLPVPPGFTIPTTYCNEYRAASDKVGYMESLRPFVTGYLNGLENTFGYMPLVSVRSGARVSMPGMMDTVLNVGLCSSTLPEWGVRLGTIPVLDSYRRLLQMYGGVVCGIDHTSFEDQLGILKKKYGVTVDSELTDAALEELVTKYNYVYEAGSHELPQSVIGQVMGAIEAVFKSWDNPRAQAYREINGYPDDWGTAVNIQSMVFGNMNDHSATGVLFTRNPATGENKLYGEYLVNAQGEDVVSGIRTPEDIHSLPDWKAGVASELGDWASKLEEHYRDMQDIEFTVQDGKLFILQCRSGKRSAKAAFRIASELAESGMISPKEALGRLSTKQYIALKQPTIKTKLDPIAKGIAAGGGCIVGRVAFCEKDAKALAKHGPVILVAKETTPDDIVAMNLSDGILTQTGGMTSHAAVVARGMNKTCVVGCTDMDFGSRTIAGVTMSVSDWITIDGQTGNVWLQELKVEPGMLDPYAANLMLAEVDGTHVIKGTEEPGFLIGENYCLDIGSLSSLDGPKLTTLIKNVRGAVLGTLYLDLHLPLDRMTDADECVIRMTGTSVKDLRVVERKRLVKAVVDSMVPCYILAPESCPSLTELVNPHQVVVSLEEKEASTVKDMLCGAKATDEFIKNVLGDMDTYYKLKSVMAIPPTPKMKTFESEIALAFRVFGE